MELENSWLGRQGQGLVAGFTWFQTRIKGLTSLVNGRRSGFARISGLQKFVISKSWSPKI